MKKLIYIFFVLLFVACNEKIEVGGLPDVVSNANYYFKSYGKDVDVIRAALQADTLNAFYAKNDYEMNELTKAIPEGIRYEIFNMEGKLKVSDSDITQLAPVDAGGVEAGYNTTYSISGMNMRVGAIFQNSSQSFEPLDICGEYGESLTTIYVCSNYFSIGDTRDCNWLKNRDYNVTLDLNDDCGVRSDYSRLAFGGKYHKAFYDAEPYLYELKRDAWHPETYGWDAFPPDLAGSTITGLRLVSGGGENPPSKIVDVATGITWHKTPVYFISQDIYTSSGFSDEYLTGAGDLNNGAKGDYLYLYLTRDTNTGRKIMLVNPYLAKYERATASDRSTKYNGENAFIPRVLMSTLLTWYSPNWQCYPSSIFSQLADKIDNSPAQTLSKYIRPGDNQRVDFIRCYDINMKMTVDKDGDGDGLPDVCANFNRNAKGDTEIFMSYSFITPEDADFWNRF